VDPKLIVHKLGVDPLYPPKKQKPMRSAKEHVDAIRQKVEESQGYKGDFLPRVAHEYHGGKKEER